MVDRLSLPPRLARRHQHIQNDARTQHKPEYWRPRNAKLMIGRIAHTEAEPPH